MSLFIPFAPENISKWSVENIHIPCIIFANACTWANLRCKQYLALKWYNQPPTWLHVKKIVYIYIYVIYLTHPEILKTEDDNSFFSKLILGRLVVGVLRQYPWQRRYDCRSGSLPEILQYRVWPVSRTETFNTQVHWPNLQRRYRAQPSVRN